MTSTKQDKSAHLPAPPPLTSDQINTYQLLEEYRNPRNWHTQVSTKYKDLQYYIHKTGLVVTPSEYIQIADIQRGGGGSRRRRSSHRKRKSYRKSKRVRHTPRKQTRRHRRSRHRHRR